MRSLVIATGILVTSFGAASPALSQGKLDRPMAKNLYEKIGVKGPEGSLVDGKQCGNSVGDAKPVGTQSVVPLSRAVASPSVWIWNDRPACLSVPYYFGTGFADVFLETFKTSFVAKKLFISFFAQGNVPTTTDPPDGVYFLCQVTQNGVTTACPGTATYPILISQNNGKQGMSHSISYSGSVDVNPDTVTDVRIAITTTSPSVAGVADICGSTVLLQH